MPFEPSRPPTQQHNTLPTATTTTPSLLTITLQLRGQECLLFLSAPGCAKSTGPKAIPLPPLPSDCASTAPWSHRTSVSSAAQPSGRDYSKPFGMSGRYGYGDTGRYDRGDGGYGGSNLGVNGYNGAGGASRDRRPGGYGGFYGESSSPRSVSPNPSPEPRRDQGDRDEQQQSSSSNPRPRTRNGDAENKYQGSRPDRPKEAPRYPESKNRDKNGSNALKLDDNPGELQSVECPS